jgi:predicted phosphodiesterase
MTTVRFQYMSDLHLELFPGFRLGHASAPYLILAGDVGSPGEAEYGAFVAHVAGLFEAVFVVLGNHEGYGYATWAAAGAAVRAVCSRHANVEVLDCSSRDVEFGGGGGGGGGRRVVRVVGATLWSEVPEDAARDVGCFLADYRRIGDLRDVSDTNALHARDLAFLRAAIARAEADGVPLVVVTHHAPSMRGTSHARNAGGPLTRAFATPLDALLRPPVAAWVHGHTHFSHAQRRDAGVQLLSNQRGYAGEANASDAQFRPDATFEV